MSDFLIGILIPFLGIVLAGVPMWLLARHLDNLATRKPSFGGLATV
ncbi:MAG: hypothetical protein FWE23_09505 [Chitinivibrionia bacterium]|nr:hypothetical protein [Chitinivibrionia bacterium]